MARSIRSSRVASALGFLVLFAGCKDEQAPCTACGLVSPGVRFGMSAQQVLTARPNARIAPYLGLAESRPDSIQYVFSTSSGDNVYPARDAKRPPKGRLTQIRLQRISVNGAAALDSVRAWQARLRPLARGAQFCGHVNGGLGDVFRWMAALSDSTTAVVMVRTPEHAVELGGAFGVVVELHGPLRRRDVPGEAAISCDDADARILRAVPAQRRSTPP